DDFTVRRALIGLAVLASVVVVAIVLAAVSWWFTTYAVDEAGVSLHRGMISRSREYAPRARIESVSVERPLLARVLGLAKVRVEVAGGRRVVPRHRVRPLRGRRGAPPRDPRGRGAGCARHGARRAAGRGGRRG